MIRAAIFDAYGTLFDVYSIAALAEELFPGHGRELAALWRDKQIEYSHLRTLSGRYADFRHVTGDALAFACAQLGLPLDEARQQRLMRQYDELTPHPENHAALQRMRAKRLPLAILSNGTQAMLDGIVRAAAMTDLFDHVLSVDRVKKFKTAPEAYQLAVDAFGCAARDMLFVSSNGWDACGAAWFGFTTFWINRFDRPPERLGVTPDATGRTMHDVADFLDRTLGGRAG